MQGLWTGWSACMSGLGLVGCSRDTSISKHLFASRHKKQLLARNLQYLAYLGCCVKKERSTHCMHNDAAQCTTCLQENPEEKRKKNTHTHTHTHTRARACFLITPMRSGSAADFRFLLISAKRLCPPSYRRQCCTLHPPEPGGVGRRCHSQ